MPTTIPVPSVDTCLPFLARPPIPLSLQVQGSTQTKIIRRNVSLPLICVFIPSSVIIPEYVLTTPPVRSAGTCFTFTCQPPIPLFYRSGFSHFHIFSLPIRELHCTIVPLIFSLLNTCQLLHQFVLWTHVLSTLSRIYPSFPSPTYPSSNFLPQNEQCSIALNLLCLIPQH